MFQDFWFCFSEWQRIVRDQPVRYLTDKFVLDEGESIRWAPRIWSQWNTAGFKAQIRAAAWDRLVRYFTRHVPGGFWKKMKFGGVGLGRYSWQLNTHHRAVET